MSRFRLALTIAGFVLAVVGVLRDDRRIVWLAIGALAVALIIRVATRRSQPR